jgi:isopentenyl-diphosphate delta-isomerase
LLGLPLKPPPASLVIDVPSAARPKTRGRSNQAHRCSHESPRNGPRSVPGDDVEYKFAARFYDARRVDQDQLCAIGARLYRLSAVQPLPTACLGPCVHHRPKAVRDVEHVVLLDENGHASGIAEKQSVHHRQTPLHLGYSCYIFDCNGRLIVTRRASTKPTWPRTWTNSCCGHPAPGEALTDAARRRARQELGITANNLKLILPGFRYRAVMSNGIVENELCPVLSATTSQLPQPNPAETDDFRLLEWSNFVKVFIHESFVVSPWCREQVSELIKLGSDPARWPSASPDLLPPAAIWTRS